MPARKVCQTFFRNALASTHQYRQNAIIDSAAALVRGASLSLTSIGRHLPGAYFHERRSLNNFHRDRVITFEQIAE